MTRRGLLKLLLYQTIDQQLRVDHGYHWCRSRWRQVGSATAKWAARHIAAVRMNSGFSGQMGQASNLQAAVLAPATIRCLADRPRATSLPVKLAR